MEEVLAAHRDVAECAVIGIADETKGQLPIGFVVLSAGTDRDEGELQSELVAMVRETIGPVAAFKTALVVNRLPKTRDSFSIASARTNSSNWRSKSPYYRLWKRRMIRSRWNWASTALTIPL